MEYNEEAIRDLLQSKTSVNTNLAFLLIQSQWKWSSPAILEYILNYQIQHFWNASAAYYALSVDDYKVQLYTQAEEARFRYGIKLVCRVSKGEQVVQQQAYLGTVEYELRLDADEPHTLWQHKKLAKDLFGRAMEELLDL